MKISLEFPTVESMLFIAKYLKPDSQWASDLLDRVGQGIITNLEKIILFARFSLLFFLKPLYTNAIPLETVISSLLNQSVRCNNCERSPYTRLFCAGGARESQLRRHNFNLSFYY